MSTAQHRNKSLAMAPGRSAFESIFERVSFLIPFKPASAILAANCMFVVIVIEGLVLCLCKSILHSRRTSSTVIDSLAGTSSVEVPNPAVHYAGNPSTMESEAAVGIIRRNSHPAAANKSRNCFSVRSLPPGKISICRSRNLPGEKSSPG